MAVHELVHEAISNEIQTKNNRINWLLVTQSFIFAAFGIISKFIVKDEDGTNKHLYQSLIELIPIFGGIHTILTIIGVSGCYIAIYGLNKQYKKLIADHEDFETLKTLIFKDRFSRDIGIFYSYSLCLLFLSMWLLIYFTFVA